MTHTNKHIALANKLIATALMLAATMLAACHSDDDGNDGDGQPTASRTLLMYMPWSGDDNALTSYFWQNISDMKTAYDKSGAADERIVVFICATATDGYMFDIDDYRGNSSSALAQYRHISSPSITTAEGIASLIGYMKALAPASSYSMTIGCHGMGWLPVDGKTKGVGAAAATNFIPYWQNATLGATMTRFFGGTSTKYQVETTTLAEAIALTGTKMGFILFDDCYMSSIEAAYDLRHAADYIIACPTEVMADGMPYATIGTHLLGTPDYDAVCQGFVSHYSSSGSPYGTIGVTACAELDSLASIMRRINTAYQFDAALIDSLQRMDGYTPAIFHDYGDYVAHLCADSAMLAQFNEQLARAVPYKGHTAEFPSMSRANGAPYHNGVYTYPIRAYSGTTTSDASTNPKVTVTRESTAWYKATH